MKRLILVGFLTALVGSTYSFVYACDHSRKSLETAAPDSKIIRTVVVDATTGCKMTTKTRVMTFDFDVPREAAPRFVHMMEREKAAMAPASPIRTAMTLGRAFITTVGAVMGSLMDRASEITASLV
jgi:hypothetical protein